MDDEARYHMTRIYNGKFFIPLGSKLFVGIEDVSLLQMNNSTSNTFRHNVQLDGKTYDENKIEFLPLKIIMQISCKNKVNGNNIILETNALYEVSSEGKIKRTNGETFQIKKPWMQHEIMGTFKCSPNLINFEIFLVESNVNKFDSGHKKSSTSKNNHDASAQSNTVSSFDIGYRFRLNYLSYEIR